MDAKHLSLTTQSEIFDIFDKQSTDRLLELATDEEELAMFVYWNVHEFYESAPDDEIIPTDGQLEDIRYILLDFIYEKRMYNFIKEKGMTSEYVYVCKAFIDMQVGEYQFDIRPSKVTNELYLHNIETVEKIIKGEV